MDSKLAQDNRTDLKGDIFEYDDPSVNPHLTTRTVSSCSACSDGAQRAKLQVRSGWTRDYHLALELYTHIRAMYLDGNPSECDSVAGILGEGILQTVMDDVCYLSS